MYEVLQEIKTRVREIIVYTFPSYRVDINGKIITIKIIQDVYVWI
jgi:hypothetical protein